jgi:hypothetical protein
LKKVKKNKKKTVKVKKKVVKYKKKAVKKKVVKRKKKKAVKKVVKKKKATKKKKKVVKKKKTTKKKKKVVKKKKTKKRKRKKKIFMQDIYAIINKVQFGKKRVVFATTLDEAPVMENNFKDVELKYDKVEMKTQVVFTLYPSDIQYEQDLLELETLDDEIPDIDQIFG